MERAGWSHQKLPCLFLLVVAEAQSRPGLLSDARLTIPITRGATESEESYLYQAFSEPRWVMWVHRGPWSEGGRSGKASEER